MKLTMSENISPWGDLDSTSGNVADNKFEDSFTDSPQDTAKDDSKEYLASLEKKLAVIQGRTQSKRESERKQLISALVQSKETHTVNFLEGDDASPFDLSQISSEQSRVSLTLSSGNAVDPQGAMGYLLKKCAPDHVAVSAEEVHELLKGDILAKVHEELHTEEGQTSQENSLPIEKKEVKSVATQQENNK